MRRTVIDVEFDILKIKIRIKNKRQLKFLPFQEDPFQ